MQPKEILPPKHQAKSIRLTNCESTSRVSLAFGQAVAQQDDILYYYLYYYIYTLALITSSRATERRGHLLLRKVWLLQNKGGSKSTSEALAGHWRSLARSPYHFVLFC